MGPKMDSPIRLLLAVTLPFDENEGVAQEFLEPDGLNVMDPPVKVSAEETPVSTPVLALN